MQLQEMAAESEDVQQLGADLRLDDSASALSCSSLLTSLTPCTPSGNTIIYAYGCKCTLFEALSRMVSDEACKK